MKYAFCWFIIYNVELLAEFATITGHRNLQFCIAACLANKVHALIAEQLDIITTPKEMDPQMTAWKGAAIMSCLESAQELWIYPVEWEKTGVKILRERAPFMW